MLDKRQIRRNTIIWVDLGAHKGHIQSGLRPCIVVSCNKANKHAPVYTVIPGTTQYDKRRFPVHFEIKPKDIEGFLKKNTIFLTEQICTIDAEQVLSIAGNVIGSEAVDMINKMIIRQLELEVG